MPSRRAFECGIVLKGTEVKSIKEGRFSFADSYALVEKMSYGSSIFTSHRTLSATGSIMIPCAGRKLLVHRKEIKRLARVTDEKGLTLVPLKFYLKRGIVKCELGIAKGKKLFDKRDDIRKRDQKREIEREYRIK